MTRCTIFGGGGYIGSHLRSYLRAQGHEVNVQARDSELNTSESLGHVFYCIGLTADFRKFPFETVRAHVTILSNVLEYANFDSLLYLSSTRIYQSSPSTSEECEIHVNPAVDSDLYNISKIMGESLCLASGRGNVRIARLSNVVGRENSSSENFFPSLCREAQGGKILLRSAITSEKDYVYIDDVTWALSNIAFNGRRNIYNVASGLNVSHSEIIERLIDHFGCKVDISPVAPEMKFPTINICRIVSEFSFAPRRLFNRCESIGDII